MVRAPSRTGRISWFSSASATNLRSSTSEEDNKSVRNSTSASTAHKSSELSNRGTVVGSKDYTTSANYLRAWSKHYRNQKPCLHEYWIWYVSERLNRWRGCSWGRGMGAATEFSLGGRIHWHPNPRSQTHLPLKFSFSSDFGHFILKCWKCKVLIGTCQEKKAVLKYRKFRGGATQMISWLGDVSPFPPPRFWRPWGGGCPMKYVAAVVEAARQ